MSVRIEFFDVRYTRAEVDEIEGETALVISADEAIAIYGDKHMVADLLRRALDAVIEGFPDDGT